MKKQKNNYKRTRIYLPIENLKVEKSFVLGKITFLPSGHAKRIQKQLEQLINKTKSNDEMKSYYIKFLADDFSSFIGSRAIISTVIRTKDEDKIIPDDRSKIFANVNTYLAVLYLLQREIAGVSSIESQKFGLKDKISHSLNYMIGIQGKNRATQMREYKGVLSDWTFIKKAIDDFENSDIYNFFNIVFKKKKFSNLENRIIASINWLYDAELDFNLQYRFIKYITALEALYVQDNEHKGFTLAKFSALTSPYISPKMGCLCPILESSNLKTYNKKLKELNLPGYCSFFWDMKDNYDLRNKIVHEAFSDISKKTVDSLAWHTHKMITIAIVETHINNIGTIDELKNYLSNYYEKNN